MKRRVDMLLFHKVVPVVVFDGGSLPMKAETNAARRVAREAALKNGNDGVEPITRCQFTVPRQARSITRPDATIRPTIASARLSVFRLK